MAEPSDYKALILWTIAVTALAVILFWLSAHAQIRTEESLLERRHGEVYRAYQARVPRWLGWERDGSMRHRRPWSAP